MISADAGACIKPKANAAEVSVVRIMSKEERNINCALVEFSLRGTNFCLLIGGFQQSKTDIKVDACGYCQSFAKCA